MLAAELGISMRTFYRDIATLQAQGADIQGEAGVGYVLRPGFTLPPLMFSTEELEALVLGSRWVPGGAVVNWPSSRKLISQSGSLYARLALGIELRDATGGYRAFRREVLERIDYEHAEGLGYCFQVELAWRALRAGFRVVEVPITFVERELGASKMSRDIVVEALLKVTGWGMAERSRQVAGAFRKVTGRRVEHSARS